MFEGLLCFSHFFEQLRLPQRPNFPIISMKGRFGFGGNRVGRGQGLVDPGAIGLLVIRDNSFEKIYLLFISLSDICLKEDQLIALRIWTVPRTLGVIRGLRGCWDKVHANCSLSLERLQVLRIGKHALICGSSPTGSVLCAYSAAT